MTSPGTRALLEQIATGPGSHLPLGELLDACGERAFGLFLLIAVLPAFLPLPAGAGAISGPLVMLAGLQIALLAEHPWLPRWLQARPVARASIERFRQRLARPLGWLERYSRPRAEVLIDHPLGHIFGGLLLLVLGLLLSLPMPLTNYPFGLLLVVWAIALIERDGRLLAIVWLLGLLQIALVLVFFDQVAALVNAAISE
ncbi:MAG: exopolysaccharide biosynthesis protein [Xanthomonadaceae bacterium]|nr:exopolysaccharide biosynthesis protein [Xanthomonadaceae bacterium]